MEISEKIKIYENFCKSIIDNFNEESIKLNKLLDSHDTVQSVLSCLATLVTSNIVRISLCLDKKEESQIYILNDIYKSCKLALNQIKEAEKDNKH